MKKLAVGLVLAAAVSGLAFAVATRGGGPQAASASSHREAPLISQDPTADNTDLYAFVSPDKPDTATIISNWIPGEDPAAGPNYYTFSPTARYDIYVDKDGDGMPDITYQFRFENQPSQFFLGNTQQKYTVTKIVGKKSSVVGSGLTTPPDNIGPQVDTELSRARDAGNPSAQRRHDGVRRAARRSVLRGRRRDLRPRRDPQRHRRDRRRPATSSRATACTRSSCRSRSRSSTTAENHTIGVWAATDRQKVSVGNGKGKGEGSQWVQVSRLGDPLINEVIIPTDQKDYWNSQPPSKDKQFEKYY